MSEENKSPLDGAIWHHMDAATIAGFGPWVRHADHVAEIERLRAKLAEAESGKFLAEFNDCNAARVRWKTRAEAAEKRLASAKEVIAPFAQRAGKFDGHWRETDTNWFPAYGDTAISVGHLRAAAEWMEKGDE